MRFLLIRNDNIGDLICTTPAIEALRKKFPHAQIDIVVNSYNAFVIKNNPYLNKIYIYTKTKHIKGIFSKIRVLIEKLKIFYSIRKKRYDVCVVFRASYSPYAQQFAKISRASLKIGPKNPKGKDIFDYHPFFSSEMHEVEYCFECLKPLKVFYKGEKLYCWVEPEFVEKFKNLNINLLFHISARKQENKMSFNKLKKIFTLLDKPIYITCAPEDMKMAEELEKTTKAEFIKTGSLFELLGVIKNAKLFVTLEGGTLHIGPALGIKTIGIFGSSNVNRWHPWGYKELAIKSPTGKAEDISEEFIVKHILNIY